MNAGAAKWIRIRVWVARCRGSRRVWALWIILTLLLVLDWRVSAPHERFAEPSPLALGHGPAPDAAHCSLAPR